MAQYKVNRKWHRGDPRPGDLYIRVRYYNKADSNNSHSQYTTDTRGRVIEVKKYRETDTKQKCNPFVNMAHFCGPTPRKNKESIYLNADWARLPKQIGELLKDGKATFDVQTLIVSWPAEYDNEVSARYCQNISAAAATPEQGFDTDRGVITETTANRLIQLMEALFGLMQERRVIDQLLIDALDVTSPTREVSRAELDSSRSNGV